MCASRTKGCANGMTEKLKSREEAEEWPDSVVTMRKKIFCGIPPSILPVFKNAGLIARENCLQAT